MNTLQVSPDSPLLFHIGAALILWLHIAGGSLGMVSGTAALVLRKGSRRHALAGQIFFVSMLVMTAIGAAVAPFLRSPQGEPKLFDATMGAFTFYLVATGWMTVRRKAGTTGSFERAACAAAFLLAASVAALGIAAKTSAGGLFGGYPATAYFIASGLIAFAASLDLKVILSGGVTGVPRISRHVWRMGLALWVAMGSFFLGQQRVMPEAIQGSLLLTIPPLAVAAAIIFWLIRLKLSHVLAQLRRRRTMRREAATPDARADFPTTDSLPGGIQYG